VLERFRIKDIILISWLI